MGGTADNPKVVRVLDRARFGATTLLAFTLAGWLLAGPVHDVDLYRAIASVLVLGLLLCAIWSVHRRTRGVVVLGSCGIVLAVVGGIASALVDEELANLFTALLIAIACLAVPILIIRALAARRTADIQAVLGVVTIYVMLGIVFAMAFQIAGNVAASPLFHTADGLTDGTYRDQVYVSFVTLSTTGYGDIAPVSGTARAIAIMDALVGQLFLVTAVATAVSLFAMRGRDRFSGEAAR